VPNSTNEPRAASYLVARHDWLVGFCVDEPTRWLVASYVANIRK
jgi:hypothetical protein